MGAAAAHISDQRVVLIVCLHCWLLSECQCFVINVLYLYIVPMNAGLILWIG